MAHFAKIENGIVTNVAVVDNAHEATGEAFLNGLGLDGTWVQTSYNANTGKKFAAISDTFDGTSFKPAEPEGNLGFDEETWSWIMPDPEIEEPVEEEPNAETV
tara:strand:- start:236 stop:544 length:309 start_codon:yes stop_codon:yes gene_type:complete